MKILLLIFTVFIGSNTLGTTNKKASKMDLEKLKILLLERNWEAVELTKKVGEDAWQILNQIIELKEFRPKEVAMSCAAQLNEEKARDYLIKGLNDKNINVNLRAAGELIRKPFNGAQPYILKKLNECEDELTGVCGVLIMALGHYPGQDSIKAIMKIKDQNKLYNAEILKTLVKLKDPSSIKKLLQIFKDGNNTVKYLAISDLSYINQKNYIPEIKKLLLDKGIGVSVGTQYNKIQRRFCDQAVDTAVKWLKLNPSFKLSSRSTYSENQINEVISLITD